MTLWLQLMTFFSVARKNKLHVGQHILKNF